MMVKGTRYEQRVADEATRPGPEMCIAKGCPYPWSIQSGGRRCCSWHFRAEPVEWPRITQRLLDDEIEVARRPPRVFAPVNVAEVRARLNALQIGSVPPRQWAYRLRERERTKGKKSLTGFQQDAWRVVLPELDPEEYSEPLPAREAVPLPGTTTTESPP